MSDQELPSAAQLRSDIRSEVDRLSAENEKLRSMFVRLTDSTQGIIAQNRALERVAAAAEKMDTEQARWAVNDGSKGYMARTDTTKELLAALSDLRAIREKSK